MLKHIILALIGAALMGCQGRPVLPAGSIEDGHTKKIVVKDAYTDDKYRIVEVIVVRPFGRTDIFDPDGGYTWQRVAANWYSNTISNSSVVTADGDDWLKHVAVGRQKEWAFALRAEVAVDPASPAAAKLLDPKSLDGLAKALGRLVETYPGPQIARNPKLGAVYTGTTEAFVLPMGYQKFYPGKATFQHQMTDNSHPLREVDEVVRAWQASLQSPYQGPGDVIARVWAWHEFVEQGKLGDFYTSKAATAKQLASTPRRYGTIFVALGGPNAPSPVIRAKP